MPLAGRPLPADEALAGKANTVPVWVTLWHLCCSRFLIAIARTRKSSTGRGRVEKDEVRTGLPPVVTTRKSGSC